MKSFRKLFLGVLNVLILAFAIFQTCFVLIYNHDPSNKQCYKNPAQTIFWLSAYLLVMSLIGLMALCCKSRSLQTFYVWLMIMTTIVVITITIFIVLTLPNESANATYQKTQKGNWINGFSPFLRSILANDKDWFRVKTCLTNKELCQGFRNHPATSPWDSSHYLELGCCSPPKRCGFVQSNVTYWEIPESGFASQDEECQMWANSSSVGGCYDCDSCKAGYLTKFQMDWHADKGVFVAILLILIVNTSLAFLTFGFRDESEQKMYRNVVNP